jgi:flagellar export protein FliJ
MTPRLCWSVLEGKAEREVKEIQADTARAREVKQTLTASRERLHFLYEEYRAKDLAASAPTRGMQDAMNHRQFMAQLLALQERVNQDMAKANQALERLQARMIKAESERLKMKSLDEQETLAFEKHTRRREQRSMDELGVMQFNRPSL